MEAAAQATPIPRAKGGEESSSKKGYEYEYDEVTYMHNLYYGQLKFLKTARTSSMIFLTALQIPTLFEHRSQVRRYYRILEEMGGDTTSNLTSRGI